ncbi:MAG: hypothetical protein GXO71_00995 [Caldiserica bacterium]|nr:hypothetical protein [Caldisericota bacterium]
MESFWVMKICQARKIPTVLVKVVSDNITCHSKFFLPFYLLKLVWRLGRSRKQVLAPISLFFENYFYT